MNRLMTAFAAVGVAGIVYAAPGCAATGIGDPCTPEKELDPSFQGFGQGAAYVESKSFQCQTRVCLVNHFRGRVSCPNGQESTGTPFSGQSSSCSVNGDQSVPVTGGVDPNGKECHVPGDCTSSENCVKCGSTDVCKDSADATGNTPGSRCTSKKNSCVPSQCENRQAENAVYCSCRCADANGQKSGNANYCTCADGFTCAQIITPTGQGNEGLTGGYCIKTNTEFNATDSCNPKTPSDTCRLSTDK